MCALLSLAVITVAVFLLFYTRAGNALIVLAVMLIAWGIAGALIVAATDSVGLAVFAPPVGIWYIRACVYTLTDGGLLARR